jgi:hypothetical protein
VIPGNKVKASSRGIPSFDDSEGWALWRLSQILAEIAQSKSTDCEAEAHLDQTSVPKRLPNVEGGGEDHGS